MNYEDELVQQVARRCYITSDDELIQKRLLLIVDNAIFSVKDLLAITDKEFDFSKPSRENELFLNYCMYRWNNRTQKEFETNYMGDIISIRTINEIKYKKSLEESNDEGQL